MNNNNDLLGLVCLLVAISIAYRGVNGKLHNLFIIPCLIFAAAGAVLIGMD